MRRARRRQTVKESVWRSKRGRQAWIVNAFKAFGRHCARNQIRVLIIDSFVMTTLFYPALALYLQRKFPPLRPPMGDLLAAFPEHPLSLLSTPILDSFFPLPPPLLPLAQDKWFFESETALETWNVDKANSLLQQSSAPGSELAQHAVVLGTTIAWTHVGAILDPDATPAITDKTTLHGQTEAALRKAAFDLGTEIGGSWTCILDPNDPERCWSESAMSQRDQQTGYETLTLYFTRRDDRVPEDQLEHALLAFHRDWREKIQDLAAVTGSEVFLDSTRPVQQRRKTLGSVWSVYPRLAVDASSGSEEVAPAPNTVPRGILALFSALLGWLLYLLARATNVHNRFGLAFTGIVELTCSTVMSYSVLTLLQAAGLGWRPTDAALAGPGVPWYILPFVILVVGVENMSALTRAVHSIPVSESVPDRIGLGLAKVGPKLFMTSITDIAVLAIVGLVVQLRPVREFCTFASVLIFVDWWMLHTFYLTVLSIDCQRLELADVLSQNSKRSLQDNAAAAPSHSITATSSQPSTAELLEVKAKTSLQRLWFNIKRARRARIGSLLLFLILLTILFYINESNRLRTTSLPGLYGYRGDQGYQQNESLLSVTPPGNASCDTSPYPWSIVNAPKKPRIALAHMPPITLVQPSPGHLISPQQFRRLANKSVRSWLPRLTPLFHLVKVVLLPQWLTAFLLYLLLLWLLKDTQLLDAQRNRPSIADKRSKSQRNLAGGRSARLSSTLSGLAVNVSAAVCTLDITEVTPLAEHLLMRSSHTDLQTSFCPARDLNRPQRIEGSAIVHSATSTDGTFWAASNSTGRIMLYRKDGESLVPRQLHSSQQSSVTGIAIRLVDVAGQNDPFLLEAPRQDVRRAPEVLTAHQDGSVWTHDLTGAERQLVRPRADTIAFAGNSDWQHVTAQDGDGGILVLDVSGQEAVSHPTLDSDAATNKRVNLVEVYKDTAGGLSNFYVVTAHDNGSVCIWHLSTGALLASAEPETRLDPASKIDKVRISTAADSASTCSRCRRPAADTRNILWSSQTQLFVVSVAVATSDDTCRCHLVRSPRTALLGPEKSLSEGFAFVGRSPRKPSNASAVRAGLVPPSPARPMSPGSEHAVVSADGSSKTNEGVSAGNFVPQASFGHVQTFSIGRGGWTVLHDGALAAVFDREPASARSHHGRRWQLTLLDLARRTEDAGFSDATSLDLASVRVATDATQDRPQQLDREAVDHARARRLSALRGIAPQERLTGTKLYQPISFGRLVSVATFGKDRVVFGMGNRVGIVTLPQPSPAADYARSKLPRRWSAVPPPRWPLEAGAGEGSPPGGTIAKEKAD